MADLSTSLAMLASWRQAPPPGPPSGFLPPAAFTSLVTSPHTAACEARCASRAAVSAYLCRYYYLECRY